MADDIKTLQNYLFDTLQYVPKRIFKSIEHILQFFCDEKRNVRKEFQILLIEFISQNVHFTKANRW